MTDLPQTPRRSLERLFQWALTVALVFVVLVVLGVVSRTNW